MDSGHLRAQDVGVKFHIPLQMKAQHPGRSTLLLLKESFYSSHDPDAVAGNATGHWPQRKERRHAERAGCWSQLAQDRRRGLDSMRQDSGATRDVMERTPTACEISKMCLRSKRSRLSGTRYFCRAQQRNIHRKFWTPSLAPL